MLGQSHLGHLTITFFRGHPQCGQIDALSEITRPHSLHFDSAIMFHTSTNALWTHFFFFSSKIATTTPVPIAIMAQSMINPKFGIIGSPPNQIGCVINTQIAKTEWFYLCFDTNNAAQENINTLIVIANAMLQGNSIAYNMAFSCQEPVALRSSNWTTLRRNSSIDRNRLPRTIHIKAMERFFMDTILFENGFYLSFPWLNSFEYAWIKWKPLRSS